MPGGDGGQVLSPNSQPFGLCALGVRDLCLAFRIVAGLHRERALANRFAALTPRIGGRPLGPVPLAPCHSGLAPGPLRLDVLQAGLTIGLGPLRPRSRSLLPGLGPLREGVGGEPGNERKRSQRDADDPNEAPVSPACGGTLVRKRALLGSPLPSEPSGRRTRSDVSVPRIG